MLTPRRFPRRIAHRFNRRFALVLAVVVAALSVPLGAHAVAIRAGQHGDPVGGAATEQPIAGHRIAVHSTTVHPTTGHPTAGEPAGVSTVAAFSPAVASGGLCSVPGIGDIGGLLHLCSLGQSGLTGDLNNICEPSVPDPEPASSGINALVSPPAGTSRGLATPYSQYGVAGTDWAATGLQCSDMTSLIGNSVSGMLFDVAKAIDRVTITVYQAAAGEGILTWLRDAADRLITGLGNAIYFPYLAIVVIIGAIWLAWQGLIRKRATRTIEGTVWMVIACAAAIWLIGRPADFTGAGKAVSDGISTTLNAAFAKLPSPGQGACLPVRKGDPQISPASYSYTSGGTVVDQNANELWTVLVCKPWLAGELGTTVYAPPGGNPTVVNTYARQLLWSQAIAVNEKPTPALIQAKQATFTGIAKSIQQNDPSIYPLFQGKEWTTRLQIGFAALLAAVLAGVLVLLISVTLIVLKLGFLLLLIVGPFFLLIGTHPGFGRVVALRWFEMLVGVLLKQAAVALVLSLLLYCYALIMGTSDAVLPWALKILMIALVTVAAFIYRRPFQHLFAAAGYGMLGATERAELDLRRAGSTLRGNTLDAATMAVPGYAAYRAARMARRDPARAAGLAVGPGAADGVAVGTVTGDAAAENLEADGFVRAEAGVADGTRGSGRGRFGARVRAQGASAGDGSGREAPPLNLPSRDPVAPVPSGWARSGGAAPAGRGTGRSSADLAAASAAGSAAAGSGPMGTGAVGSGTAGGAVPVRGAGLSGGGPARVPGPVPGAGTGLGAGPAPGAAPAPRRGSAPAARAARPGAASPAATGPGGNGTPASGPPPSGPARGSGSGGTGWGSGPGTGWVSRSGSGRGPASDAAAGRPAPSGPAPSGPAPSGPVPSGPAQRNGAQPPANGSGGGLAGSGSSAGTRAPGSGGLWSGSARRPVPPGPSAPAARPPASPPAIPAAPAAPAGRTAGPDGSAPRAAGPFASRRADQPRRWTPPPMRPRHQADAGQGERPAPPPPPSPSPRPAGRAGVHAGPASGRGGPGDRDGAAGSPPAGPGGSGGQGGSGGSGGQGGQETARQEAPVPFWLRPVRRRK